MLEAITLGGFIAVCYSLHLIRMEIRPRVEIAPPLPTSTEMIARECERECRTV
jgi:hypothetical protein